MATEKKAPGPGGAGQAHDNEPNSSIISVDILVGKRISRARVALVLSGHSVIEASCGGWFVASPASCRYCPRVEDLERYAAVVKGGA